MPFFLCRLLPPRPGFAQDSTERERAVMGAHAVYLAGEAEAGRVVAFGPVLDPAGAWGLGLVEVADEEAARRLTAADPAILAGIGLRYEIHPMPVVGLRPGLDRSHSSRHETPGEA